MSMSVDVRRNSRTSAGGIRCQFLLMFVRRYIRTSAGRVDVNVNTACASASEPGGVANIQRIPHSTLFLPSSPQSTASDK